jgi:hypothetical protein
MKNRAAVLRISACAVSALALSPAHARAQSCFLDITRPLLDPTPWSASCEPASTVAGGASINLLEGKPDCKPDAAAPCFEDPGIEVHLTDPLPKEGDANPPSCFPAGKPHEWAHMGFANIHKSCFRALSQADHKQIAAWAKQDFRPGDMCRMDEFGEQALDKKDDFFRTEDKGPALWAARFGSEYPSDPKTKPGSPAEAIYAGFHKALDATDSCIEAVNPGLASRVRQAMGVEFRAGTGSVFRPSIECAQQQAYKCEGAPSVCEAARAQLEPMFRQGLDPIRQDEGYSTLRKNKCAPAHPHGTILGSVDATNLVDGAVAKGSPKIRIFNPTALFGQGAQGASTLFHEFLHAAGAQADKDHNHGTEDDDIKIPATDQVYACQALAFTPLFEHISDAQLESACLKCADESHADLCRKGRDFIESRMKCRVSK